MTACGKIITVMKGHWQPLFNQTHPLQGNAIGHGMITRRTPCLQIMHKGIEAGRYFYWRQLRDMKGSAKVEKMSPLGLTFYAGPCGWTLARAHARSGDPVAIAAYLGKNHTFATAIAEFAERYTDRNERDYEAFVGAIRSGRLAALEGV